MKVGEQLAKLEEMVKQHATEISKLFEISSKLNGAYYKDHEEQLTLKNQMDAIHEKLDTIIQKVDHTNGTVRLHTKILYIVSSVGITLLITNGSELVNFLLKII